MSHLPPQVVFFFKTVNLLLPQENQFLLKKLQQVYNSEDFRKRGHQLIDELANHFENTLSEKSEAVIRWNSPENEREFWLNYLENGKEEELFKKVLEHSIHVHHPRYIGHQVSPAAPITTLSAIISASLNNGMAVYEMGIASSAIERIVTDKLCNKIGWDDSANGILTSGGTLANLTALLTARKAKASGDVWLNGNNKQLGIMVCEQAHYCIERAAKIMSLGESGIVKIPANASFAMDTSQLEYQFELATKNGIEIFAIIGNAPSTSTGMCDDLQAIADFAITKNIWFHVDGAHGGAAIFSEKYKYTLNGIEKADSVVIDGHKMMMMPALTTALLFKDGKTSHATFTQKADYLLLESKEVDWYNIAKRTFECTKNMMSLHWFTLIKTYGEEIFDEYFTSLYNLGYQFGEMLHKHTSFEMPVKPQSNIVCFRYVKENSSNEELNKINLQIRQQLLEEGHFYIVQTVLNGKQYLRVTIMNSFTTEGHLQKLLELVLNIAEN